MNDSFGTIDPVTTYRLIRQEQEQRHHHAHPGEIRRPSGRHSFAQSLRRAADLIDG